MVKFREPVVILNIIFFATSTPHAYVKLPD
jgi:hypothetical protein